MEEYKKLITLEERLQMHFLFEFIDNNEETKSDYSIGQLYADTKTKEIMKIINEWKEDGEPE